MSDLPVTFEEILTFFAVFTRFTVLIALIPFFGDKIVPGPVKILFSLCFTLILYPTLVKIGFIKPAEALIWGTTTSGIVVMVGLEALVGLVFGFIARLAFDTILFAGGLINSFIGLSSATIFDPHHETQSMILSEMQMAFAMLLFLAMDGHHLMLSAAVESFSTLGLGRIQFNQAFATQMIQQSAEVIRIGVQMSGPVAVSIFAVQVAMGVLSKAMPQVNILVLSFAVTILVGLSVLYISFTNWVGVSNGLYTKMENGLHAIVLAMAGK